MRFFSSACQIGRAVALRKHYPVCSDRRRILNLIVHSTDTKLGDKNPFFDLEMRHHHAVEEILVYLETEKRVS
jgi:hypothetical protein